MRFVIQQADFRTLLARVGQIADPKAQSSAARAVALSVLNGKLTATCQDAAGAFSRHSTPADAVEEGRALADHAWLSSVVGILPHVDVEVFATPSRMTLRAGSVTAAVNLMADDVWLEPTVPESDGGIIVDAAAWSNAIEQASRAASRNRAGLDATSMILRSVRIHAFDGRIRLTSTDRNLAARIDIDADVDGDRSILVPADMLPTPDEGRITVAFDGGRLIVTGDDGTDVRLAVDHRPPDVDRVLAGYDTPSSAVDATMDRAELITSIRRLRMFADNPDFPRLNMRDTGGGLTMSVHGPEGDCEDVIDLESAGEPLNVAVNAAVLARALEGLDGDRVHLRINEGDTTPIMLENPERPQARFCAVRMRRVE